MHCRILEAANRAILEHGIKLSTLDAVAEAAQVSKGALHLLLPQQRALIQGMIQDRIDRYQAITDMELRQESTGARGCLVRAHIRAETSPSAETLKISAALLAAVADDPSAVCGVRELGYASSDAKRPVILATVMQPMQWFTW